MLTFFDKLGYIIACIMGFVSLHFGYAYDGPSEDWPNYNPARAATVSKDVVWTTSRFHVLTALVDGSSCTPTN